MRRRRSPFQKRLLLFIGQARRMIERRVISGGHRTALDRLLDSLKRFALLLIIVGLPIGKIQNLAC